MDDIRKTHIIYYSVRRKNSKKQVTDYQSRGYDALAYTRTYWILGNLLQLVTSPSSGLIIWSVRTMWIWLHITLQQITQPRKTSALLQNTAVICPEIQAVCVWMSNKRDNVVSVLVVCQPDRRKACMTSASPPPHSQGCSRYYYWKFDLKGYYTVTFCFLEDSNVFHIMKSLFRQMHFKYYHRKMSVKG